MMEMYREAYEYYRMISEKHGMESVNIYHFVKHLTEEQLNEYRKQAI